MKEGELFGLIGPDGAGKSSLFRILTTLSFADEGEATVIGHDVVKDFRTIRNEIGYMPGKFSLYQDLTVAENLEFFATIFGTTIAENYELIKDIYVQLEPFKDRLAGKLSGGMKQKLAAKVKSITVTNVAMMTMYDVMRTCFGMAFRKSETKMLELINTNMVAKPIAKALIAVLVTANAGHMPNTATKTGFSFQSPLMNS